MWTVVWKDRKNYWKSTASFEYKAQAEQHMKTLRRTSAAFIIPVDDIAEKFDLNEKASRFSTKKNNKSL